MPTDNQLLDAMRDLSAEIARTESHLAELKTKFRKLDDALAILSEQNYLERSANTSGPNQFDQSSLQDLVLAYLMASSNPEGELPREIADGLRLDSTDRYKDRNSFIASIYVTLGRLLQQGKVQAVASESGKRWLIPNSSLSIFD